MTRAFCIFFFLAGLWVLSGCSGKSELVVPKMDFEEFEPLLKKQNDTVYVINFWATWCKPCIKELPEFEKLQNTHSAKNVKIYLVSLDFPDKHNELLLPYLRENNIKSQVIHLIDTDANNWIDKVSPLWSGAIPATLIYKGNAAEFYETVLTYDQLKSIVESKM